MTMIVPLARGADRPMFHVKHRPPNTPDQGLKGV